MHYDPLTGDFTWLIRTSQRTRVGDVAGCLDIDSGYWSLVIDGKRHRGHRVAWLYMKGKWPVDLLDHEDTDRANNRWNNLRPANHSKNKANRAAPVNNTTGFKGVTKSRNRFIAQIAPNGKNIYLGTYDTKEEASAAYAVAAIEHFGEFARA